MKNIEMNRKAAKSILTAFRFFKQKKDLYLFLVEMDSSLLKTSKFVRTLNQLEGGCDSDEDNDFLFKRRSATFEKFIREQRSKG